MAWIKFDKDLVDDPRILRAAEKLASTYTLSVVYLENEYLQSGEDFEERERLAFMRNAVTGALVTLWVYADTHIRSGDVLELSVTAIDRMVGIDGFCELLGDEWIKPSADGQSVVLPGYCEKNGLATKEKRRASNADRQRRFRERSNANRNAVTNARSNASVTPLDQDRDQDLKKGARVARFPDGINQQGTNGWWKSDQGIEAMGKELDSPARPGESYAQYKDRLFTIIAQRKQVAG